MSQLSQIFTNIANAIRNKTGSNELITPPQMATAIDNIPSGGSATAYCWSVESSRFPPETTYAYISADVAPANSIEAYATKVINGSLQTGSVEIGDLILVLFYTYTRISDTEFTISWIDGRDAVTLTYTRDSTKDFTLWELSE